MGDDFRIAQEAGRGVPDSGMVPWAAKASIGSRLGAGKAGTTPWHPAMKGMVALLIEWVIDFAYCFAFRLFVQHLSTGKTPSLFIFGGRMGDYDNDGWPGVNVLSNRKN